MMSDKDYSESAMIAFLPSDGYHDVTDIDLPHMTLVYAGENLPLSGFNEMAKDAAMLASFVKPFWLVVKARERFGDNHDVDAFSLRPTPTLWSIRRVVERWNKSEHPFKPHVTIGSPDVRIENPPKSIGFDRLLAKRGEDNLVFWLR